MKREGTGTGIGDVRGQGGEAERGRGDRDDVRGGQGEARGDGAKQEGMGRSKRGRGTILPRKGNGDRDSVRYHRRRGIRVGVLLGGNNLPYKEGVLKHYLEMQLHYTGADY